MNKFMVCLLLVGCASTTEVSLLKKQVDGLETKTTKMYVDLIDAQKLQEEWNKNLTTELKNQFALYSELVDKKLELVKKTDIIYILQDFKNDYLKAKNTYADKELVLKGEVSGISQMSPEFMAVMNNKDGQTAYVRMTVVSAQILLTTKNRYATFYCKDGVGMADKNGALIILGNDESKCKLLKVE